MTEPQEQGISPHYLEDISLTVSQALKEDLKTFNEDINSGAGDLTAQLIDPVTTSEAEIVTRQNAIICGIPWVNETFRQLDDSLRLAWFVKDGEPVVENQLLCRIQGNSRSLLTGERTALNFLQTLSGTATKSHQYSQLIAHTQCQLLDTRKTLPGLRKAQKYAVMCGGCRNHRMGLYDAFLIKENHIHACGSIAEAIHKARSLHPDKLVEIEVENLGQYLLAVDAQPDWIMLDNFSIEDMKTAVSRLNEEIKLEASGGIETEDQLIAIAETGVDFVSVGALTKHVEAVDLSMRFV